MNKSNGRSERIITILRVVLPILLIVAGLLVAKRIYDTRPKPKRRPPMRIEPLVRVTPVRVTTYTPMVNAYGEVIPAREIDLQPLVSGEVTSVHPQFREGGIVPVGDTVIKIDPRDYAVAVARAEAAVANAKLALAVEQGAGEVAQRERTLLGSDANLSASEEALITREPHRDAADRTLAAAEADLAHARLDLERTTVRAPFTGLIQAPTIEQGGLASSQRAIAHLIDAETYWVRASVPINQLQPILEAPSQARQAIDVTTMNGKQTTGRLIGSTGTVDAQGRMASLLIAIDGPARDNSSGPLIGDYVQVALPTAPLENVIQLPQSALHDQDTVWLADTNDQIAIVSATIVWRGHDYVYVDGGLQHGDRVVTTPLSSVVEGTSLRIVKDTSDNE